MSQNASRMFIQLANERTWEKFKTMDLDFLEDGDFNPKELFASEPWTVFSDDSSFFSENTLSDFADLLVKELANEVVFIFDSIDYNCDLEYGVYYYFGDEIKFMSVYEEDYDDYESDWGEEYDDEGDDEYDESDDEYDESDDEYDESNWEEDSEPKDYFDVYNYLSPYDGQSWIQLISQRKFISSKEKEYLEKFDLSINL